VVGLHHWIGWRLKFFCWKSSTKWVTEYGEVLAAPKSTGKKLDPTGWHTIFIQTVEYSLALFVTAIHVGKWDVDSGILSYVITRWNLHSWGC
jgi:hypothetical protein